MKARFILIGAFLILMALMLPTIMMATVYYAPSNVTVSGVKSYINGIQVQATPINITTPELTFKITVETGGEVITRVHISGYKTHSYDATTKQFTRISDQTLFYDVTMQETITDKEWTYTYTLPSYGGYLFMGTYEIGTDWYQVLSVTSMWDESGETFAASTAETVNLGPIQITLGFIGIICIIYGLIASKKRGRWS